MPSFFAKNMLWNAIYQLSAVIAGFLIPRSIIAAYGSQVNGLVSSLTQLIGYFALVEAGISGAATFALYQPLSNNDWGAINKIASASRRFYRRSGSLFLALLAVLSLAYPLVIACEGMSSVEIMLLVFLLGTKTAVDFFSLSKYRVFLTADKKNWVIQLGSTVYTVLNTAIIVALSHLQAPIDAVYGLATLAVFTRSLILALYTRRVYPNYDCTCDSAGVEFPQRWDALFLQVLAAVQSGAPVILATILVADLKEVSVLSIYLLIASGMQMIPGVLSTGMQAEFGRLIASGRIEDLRKRFGIYRASVYATLACVVGCGAVLALPFVDLYTSSIVDANYHNPVLCALIVANVFLFHAKTPQGLLVIAAGMYRETRAQTALQALLIVVLGIPLTIQYGICGVMLASCVSNLYRVIDLLVFVPVRITHELMRVSFEALLICLIQTTIVALPGLLIHPCISSWSDWVIVACAQAIWGMCAVLLVLYTADRSSFHAIAKVFRGNRG